MLAGIEVDVFSIEAKDYFYLVSILETSFAKCKYRFPGKFTGCRRRAPVLRSATQLLNLRTSQDACAHARQHRSKLRARPKTERFQLARDKKIPGSGTNFFSPL